MTTRAAATVLARCIELDLRLHPEPDLNRLLQRACQSAQGLCVARYAAAAVFDERSDAPAAFAGCGLPSTLGAAAFAARRGALGELLRDGVALRTDVPAGDTARLGLPDAHPPVQSFLAVPLASRGRPPWGWLYLADKRDASTFSETDEQAALTIAAQLATLLR